MTRRIFSPFNGVALAAALPHSAAAHGLGERYSLPLPLDLYLLGGALVVALSFVLLAAFAGARSQAGRPPPRVLTLPPLPGERGLVVLVRWISGTLFVLLIIAGLVGSPDPFKNPLPVSVWILGWVGIAYVSGLVGNVWALINPWDNLFRLGEWLAVRWRGRAVRPPLAYPPALGAWPAALLFLMFAWMELVWPERDHPDALAAAILAYSAITWTGMAVFGRRAWRDGGEAFAVAFGLLARFAVLGHDERGRLALRWPATGLLVRAPVPPSTAAFAILMLATVTFDGLLETPPWAALADWAGAEAHVPLATAALIAFPLVFAGVYLAVARLMAAAAGEERGGGLACRFVLTLVPIAIGYHLAHYLSYLLIAGQFIIPILSDPFALGWNLFGTRLYLIDFSVIDSRSVWYASLALIVTGHVIAVWLAHTQARQCAHTLRSQLPMVLLMIGYTAISLWILAQPITERAV